MMTTTRSHSGDSDAPSAHFPSARTFWSCCGLPADRLDQFITLIERYRQLISDGNRITSLVAEDSLGDFDTKHVCDSLAVLRAFPGLLGAPWSARGVGWPCDQRSGMARLNDSLTMAPDPERAAASRGAVAAVSSGQADTTTAEGGCATKEKSETPARETPMRVADLGSGAGLPGIVLALALPQLSLTAIEPNHKKAEFLARAMRELGLAGRASVVTKPGRELGRDLAFAGEYDVVLARAVSSADKLITECRRLVSPGGCMIFYKTPAAVQAELPLAQREARKHKLELTVSEIVELPADAGARQFILLRKPESGNGNRESGSW